MRDALIVVFDLFSQLSSFVPLPVFIFLGSFLEEIIAPLPSAVVTTVVGSQLSSSAYPLLYLIVLAAIAGAAKTLAAVIYYIFADKVEDLVISRWGNVIGIHPGDLEKLGTQFSEHIQDELLIFALRAFPLAPTGVVSLACGVLKIPFRSYVIVTWLGYTVRNCIQLYLAYVGFEFVKSLLADGTLNLPIQLFFLLSGPALLVGLGLFLKQQSTPKKPSKTTS